MKAVLCLRFNYSLYPFSKLEFYPRQKNAESLKTPLSLKMSMDRFLSTEDKIREKIRSGSRSRSSTLHFEKNENEMSPRDV